MKAGYFFTDVPPGAANTWIVPRSHLLEQELERPEIGQPKGAIPIVCKANTCLLFDRRLYHAATPNWVSECQQTIIASHHQRLALAFVVGLAHQQPMLVLTGWIWCTGLEDPCRGLCRILVAVAAA
eukprot:COSAG01_NODE_36140_length_521_cov_4.812796_1_plen_126_part_00